jgi:tight adherence protein B
MIARERLRREVRALTAEGRISAIILGLLPVGLGAVMYSINRPYMNVLLHDGFGQVLLIGSGLLAVVGFYWMKKTIEIDI